jgi:hypothetical protein
MKMTKDVQHGAAEKRKRKFSFVNADDPADALSVGAAAAMSVSSANDSTTALGGAADLGVSLSHQPQETVFVSATTSNQPSHDNHGVHARVHHGQPRGGADGAGRGRHAAPGRHHVPSGPGPS